MKTVVCFGDSNTYGFDPVSGKRFPKEKRWPGIMSRILGDGYDVVEEGCNGRTTMFYDPVEPWKNGLEYLKPCLHSHNPIDIVTVMLGTNDLKQYFFLTPEKIAEGAETIVKVLKEYTVERYGKAPEVILISPPQIGETIEDSEFSDVFYKDAVERSLKLPPLYEAIAEKYGCKYINTQDYVKPSSEDAVHLYAEGHEILAKTVANVIVSM